MELLIERGAIVSYNDPHIPVLPPMRHYRLPALASEPLTADYLAAQDCVLVATEHSLYDWDFIAEHARLIVDSRNATRQVAHKYQNIRQA
jgi:UDP-N-acetyl-D-glucosamine dehydrogenase